jgi:hypothetical protein
VTDFLGEEFTALELSREAARVLLQDADGEMTAGELQAVLSRNGVTTFAFEGEADLEAGLGEARVYGAWLEHSAFAVVEVTAEVQEVSGSGLFSAYLGARSGSPPADLEADARYVGLMVGSPIQGARSGNRLQGDAELVYSMDDGDLDASFTDIKDLDRGVAWETEEIQFTNIGVNTGGDFFDATGGTEESPKTIRGSFYGPDHEEVAGFLEVGNIVGSFGASLGANRDPGSSGQ